MCGYFCIGFIDLMLAGKTLTEFTNLDEQQFRLNKINEVKYYFLADIKERELMSKRLGKYIAFFCLFW